jgi:transposase-like protein
MKSRHSDQTKAQAVAAVKSGEAVNDVARRFDVPKQTVSRWAKEAGIDVGQIGTEKKKNLAELIADTLTENLLALQSIAIHGRDKAWQERQNASDLGVFYGVVADKTIRILEAHVAAQPVEAE